MKKTIPKLRAARKSWTVWLLAAGIAMTEVMPHVVESLPLAREAFGDETYKLIVRIVFLVGIALRVASTKVARDDE